MCRVGGAMLLISSTLKSQVEAHVRATHIMRAQTPQVVGLRLSAVLPRDGRSAVDFRHTHGEGIMSSPGLRSVLDVARSHSR